MKYRSLQDRIMSIVFYIITGIFAFICMVPLWIMLAASLTNEVSLMQQGYKLYITKFDLAAYRIIFSSSNNIINSYGITIITTVGGVLLTLLITSALAYPLSVRTLKFRKGITFFAYMTMLFNGGLVPTYILYVKYLHLNNNIWVLIIPGALNAYNMFLMKNYFTTIPDSLSESAKIDGANDIYIFWKVIIPLAKPILATIGLFAAMTYWNEWFRVLMYIDNPKLYTLQFLIMRLQRTVEFLNSSLGAKASAGGVNVQIPSYTIRMATAIISIGPIVILYPFLQKYFIKGIMIGAIKG